MLGRVEKILADDRLESRGMFFDGNSVKVRLADTDAQLKARDAIETGAEHRPGRPDVRGRAQPPVGFAPVADHLRALRCTSAWICAEGCTSCCRST